MSFASLVQKNYDYKMKNDKKLRNYNKAKLAILPHNKAKLAISPLNKAEIAIPSTKMFLHGLLRHTLSPFHG